MELLEKFAAVKIKADSCISEQDRQYCEAHQAAYESALAGFRELIFFAADMKMAQKELLEPWKAIDRFHDYLVSPDGPVLSQDTIEAHIRYLHMDHIHLLIRYFNEIYHIKLDQEDISKAVLPEGFEDQSNHMKAAEVLHEQPKPLAVHYQSVVEQIILRLNGRSFSEQALCELCERCHNAAWNISKQAPKFEAVKGTIRFLENFCSYDCGVCERWALKDEMREILRGAAHFETDNFHTFPRGVPELLDGKSLTVDFIDWPGNEKIKGLKMFKNGRVDLKFANEEFAGDFTHKYLGILC